MGRRFIVTPKEDLTVLVEAERIKPEIFAGKTLDEIRELIVYEGNRRRKLGELFNIQEEKVEGEEISIVLRGDFSKVSRIGEEMGTGEIIIDGNCGSFLGYKMKGGKIIVKGDAGSWLGAEMRKGTIEVYGNAGDHVGAPLRGLKKNRAMRGGMIIIHGDAGTEVGAYMVKGTIIVEGNCSVLPGLKMSGGTVLIMGDCMGKAGARMSGGKVIICGKAGEILPSFYIDSIVPSVKAKGRKIEGPFYLFLGDVLENASCSGRLFVSVNNNPELKVYEELIESGGT